MTCGSCFSSLLLLSFREVLAGLHPVNVSDVPGFTIASPGEDERQHPEWILLSSSAYEWDGLRHARLLPSRISMADTSTFARFPV